MVALRAESTPRPNKAGPGLRTFFRIADAWQLTPAEQMVVLGQPPRSTFYKWRDRPDEASLSRDTFERLSYILASIGASRSFCQASSLRMLGQESRMPPNLSMAARRST